MLCPVPNAKPNAPTACCPAGSWGCSPTDVISNDTVPSHFRKRLAKAGIAEAQFAAVLAQRKAAGVMIKRAP